MSLPRVAREFCLELPLPKFENPPKPLAEPPNIESNISPKSKPAPSKLEYPPNPPAPGPPFPTPAWPYWSYIFLLLSSDSTEYASWASLNFSAAFGSSLFKSGWNSFAFFLNADFISASVASLETPKTS